MSIDRRSLIKAMALSGFFGSLPGRTPAGNAAVPAPPHTPAARTIALVHAGRFEDAFLGGVRAGTDAAALKVRRGEPGIAFLMDVERQLGAGPLRVVGLLDDALAAPLLTMARGNGARMPWFGLHTAGAGMSRHRLATAGIAEGCARRLGRELHACGGGFELAEERRSGAEPTRRMAAAARGTPAPDQWAASLGYLLATLGRDGRRPAPARRPNGAAASGSFVSFLIES